MRLHATSLIRSATIQPVCLADYDKQAIEALSAVVQNCQWIVQPGSRSITSELELTLSSLAAVDGCDQVTHPVLAAADRQDRQSGLTRPSAEARRTAGFGISLLAAAPARAQLGAPPGAEFVHEVWTVVDGLPVNSVTNVLQGRDGYLWLATWDGLFRFDGFRFTVFNTGNSVGLPSNRIVELVQDADGSLSELREWRSASSRRSRSNRAGGFALVLVEGEGDRGRTAGASRAPLQGFQAGCK
jgi:hypothetical protein